MFNHLKLSQYFPLFREQKCLIVGAGAVGTYIAEFLAKMGAGYIHLIDFDHFSLENASKHSGMIRTPEDVTKNKATATALRVQALMIPEGVAMGTDANICSIGPEALTVYSAAFLALDNYAAKVYFNKIWLSLPREKRPVVFMGGTNGELAESYVIDGSDLCLRCLFDESWLEDSARRTSCSGPQYRLIDGQQEIIRTSGLASGMAAHLMCEQFRAFVTGCGDIVNKRICYTAYPNPGLMITEPLRRPSCPDCRDSGAEGARALEGSVLNTTLEELFGQISEELDSDDFAVMAHMMDYNGVVYNAFITDDYCHACGKPVTVNAHEGRTRYGDVLCAECAASGEPAAYDSSRPAGSKIRSFSPGNMDAGLRNMTLYSLGYPVGAYINVKQRDAAAADFLTGGTNSFHFYMRYDAYALASAEKL